MSANIVTIMVVTILWLITIINGSYLPDDTRPNSQQEVIFNDDEESFLAKPPYLHSINQYFKQSTQDNEFEIEDNEDEEDELDDIISIEDINNISLKKPYTWQKVLDDIRNLNIQHGDKKSYKLFYLQRHGEGWHNYAMSKSYYNSSEWGCYWQLQSGDDVIEWEDALLTPLGIKQINNLRDQFDREELPFPNQFYVSPLRRTVKTWELMWKDKTDQKAIVKEFARESYGIGTESKRHDRKYLEDNFDFLTFENGFNDEDVLWTDKVHESKQHRNWRAQTLLIDIFQQLKQEEVDVISIVSHSGLISSILKVIGHKKWKLPTGSMIPVVIGIDWDKFGKVYKLSKPWKTMEDYCPIKN
ncbi:histidine phosphatase superfamily [Scheffersomyces coipomensis]|uniref:histidine phosphatase superfamily n=1 Tax=Scheffersomyces coipomensis TaxID=1788519 RepID=UPI00315D7182